MNSRIKNRSKLFKNAGTTTQGRSCTVQTSTTSTTIPTLRILKCNNASRFFLFLFIYFYSLHTVYPHWIGRVKRKIEIFYAFSTPRIFHTPHFPHSSFSTPRIFHTPHFPHSALRVFHRTEKVIFFIKLINRQGVIIPRRRELPCQFFAATALSGRSCFNILCLHASVVVLVAIEIVSWT